MKKTRSALAWFLILTMLTMGFAACDKTDEFLGDAYTVEFVVDNTIYTTRELRQNAMNLPDPPIKEGYEFKGWYFDEAFTEALTGANLAAKPLGVTYKVYARWESGSAKKLSVPANPVLNGTILSWGAVTNASQYQIQIGNLNFTTDKTSYDLAGTITAQGRYLVFIKAISNSDTILDSDWSEGVVYTIGGTNATDLHTAFNYGLGFGYDIVNADYYDARRASTYSPLDLSQLNSYVGTTTYSESGTNYAKGETMEEYLLSYSSAIGAKTGASGQYKCFTAGASAAFDSAFNAQVAGHNYQAFFTYFANVEKNAYAIKNCSEESYRNMLSNDFMREINREKPETQNLTDAQLAEWLIARYGTHIVTGISLGGRIECSYYITANSREVGVSIVESLETAASAGVSGVFEASGESYFQIGVSGNHAISDKRVVLNVRTFGGDGGKIATLSSDFSETNYNAWVDSLATSANAVRLTDGGLLSLHVLIPTDAKYDGLRAALIAKFNESADSAYNSVLSKYYFSTGGEIEYQVDLTDLYSSDNASKDAKSAFSHTLYDNNTGIFTVKGSQTGTKIDRYVFTGLYNAKDANGDTCKNIIQNFTIQIDAEEDIEIILDHVSLQGAAGLPAIRLNPNKNQNITVTLIVNGESILIGGHGVDGTGGNGGAAIDFSFGKRSVLEITGTKKLTLKGGNGGKGRTGNNGSSSDKSASSGSAGGNGGNGAPAVVAIDFRVTCTGLVIAYSGNGGNGGNGGSGGNITSVKYTGVPTCGHGANGGNGGNSAKTIVTEKLQIDSNMQLFVGNGGNGGKGGNGGNGRYDLVHWCNGGNAGSGGNGGNSYETAVSASNITGSYSEEGGSAGALGLAGSRGKGNGNDFWSSVDDRYGNYGSDGKPGNVLA